MEEKRISASSSSSFSVSRSPNQAYYNENYPNQAYCNENYCLKLDLRSTHLAGSGPVVDDFGKVVGEAENVKGESRT